MKNLPLHWKIIGGMLLGIAWAIVSAMTGLSAFNADWIMPWGTIFINVLKLIAMPLVLFSVIKGMTDLQDLTRLGRMGARTLSLYLITTVSAVALGLTLVNLIAPGRHLPEEQRIVNRISYELWAAEDPGVEVADGRSFLDDPAYAGYVAGADSLRHAQGTAEVLKGGAVTEKVSGSGPLQFLVDIVPGNIFRSLSDMLMLQIIFFAIFFGITLILVPKEKAEPVVRFVDGANEVFLKMVDIVMNAAPFFVFALMAGTLSQMAGDDPQAMLSIFRGLGVYMITVAVGLLIMVTIFYPAVMVPIVARKRGISAAEAYRAFFRGIGPAQLLAFSTSSSAATLPVTMECVRDRLGVPDETTSFVLPIGATVNMDGTSLYQAVAVVFLAQFHMIDLTLAQQATIVLTATLASIGSAAVPSAGLVMLILVLQSVDLNPAWIAIIFPVDRILDMCRTVVNVTGDATVASVVAAMEGKR